MEKQRIGRFLTAFLAALFLAAALPAAGLAADKDTLVIAFPESISLLDAGQEGAIAQYYIQQLVTEGLVAIDATGKVSPALADSWTEEDATVWTFTLRQGAKFSDGTPVTAEDVLYSIERDSDPEREPSIAYFWPEGYVAEALDDATIRITLPWPQANFIWSVSNNGGLFVVKKDWAENALAIGGEQDLLLGSGPYKVTDFRSGSSVTLTRQDYWWGEPSSIPNIRIDFITDNQTRLLAFMQGDVDFAFNIPTAMIPDYETVDGATVVTYKDRSYNGITFDLSVPPFDNEHVRKAVAYAIDAAGIVRSVLDGYGEVATAFTAPEQFAAAIPPDEARELLAGLTHYAYDMEKAKEEFALSGVEPFSATLEYSESIAAFASASLFIADSLKEIGITLDVKPVSIEKWLNEMGSGTKGMDWMQYCPPTLDPGEIAVWFTDTSSLGANPANWTDESVIPYYERFMSTDLSESLPDLLAAMEIAQAQAIYAPLWWGEAAVAYNKTITVDAFDSLTLLSQNWARAFAFAE